MPSPETEYISQDDENEAERLRLMSTSPLGEPLFMNDEDFRLNALHEFGFDTK